MTGEHDLRQAIYNGVTEAYGASGDRPAYKDYADKIVGRLTQGTGWLILPGGAHRVVSVDDMGRPNDNRRLFEVWTDD